MVGEVGGMCMPSHSRGVDERALDANEEEHSPRGGERAEWHLHVPQALLLELLQSDPSWAKNGLSDTAGQVSAGCAVQRRGDERKLRRGGEPAVMQVVPVTLVECIHRDPGTQSVQTLPHTHTHFVPAVCIISLWIFQRH